MEVHGQAIQSHRQFRGASSGGRRGRPRVLRGTRSVNQGMSFVKPAPGIRAKPLLIRTTAGGALLFPRAYGDGGRGLQGP